MVRNWLPSSTRANLVPRHSLVGLTNIECFYQLKRNSANHHMKQDTLAFISGFVWPSRAQVARREIVQACRKNNDDDNTHMVQGERLYMHAGKKMMMMSPTWLLIWKKAITIKPIINNKFGSYHYHFMTRSSKQNHILLYLQDFF